MARPILKQALAVLSIRRWRILAYIVLLAAGFELERTGDHAPERGALSETARATYQRISTLGYRKPEARYTALVLLDDKPNSGHDPPDVAHNGCKRRLYLAKLIRALQLQGAVVIVLDFRFEAACRTEDEELSNAISEATKSNIPVVVGQDSTAVSSIRREEPGSIGPGINDSDLVPIRPSIFHAPQSALYGLIMLAADTRRIPLEWAIAAPGSDPARLTERHVQDSLSFSAAVAHKRSLLQDPKLHDYLSRGAWPLTSFITEDKFPRQPGLDLICRGQDSAKWWECNPQSDAVSIFKGYVAVVGFGDNNNGPDMHDSVLGYTPGIILQANYIEALLDGRFLSQSPLPLQILLSFLCFAAIEIVFEFIPKIWAALPIAVLVVVVFYAMSYLAMVQFGYYLDLWIPSALALLLKVISSLQSRAKEKVVEKDHTSPTIG